MSIPTLAGFEDRQARLSRDIDGLAFAHVELVDPEPFQICLVVLQAFADDLVRLGDAAGPDDIRVSQLRRAVDRRLCLQHLRSAGTLGLGQFRLAVQALLVDVILRATPQTAAHARDDQPCAERTSPYLTFTEHDGGP